MKTSPVSKDRPIWLQIISVFGLPVIGLYVLAYRLLGIRYTYRLGNFDVTPLEPITKYQYMFTRAFPAMILLPAIGLLALLTNLN